jgi:hypothetical protein
MIFMLVAVAGTDEWLALGSGAAVSNDARERVGRRAGRPLVPVVVAILGLLVLLTPSIIERIRWARIDRTPAPLARPLTEIPSELAGWSQEFPDLPQDRDAERILGTPHFLNRLYSAPGERGGGSVTVWITYYTGPSASLPIYARVIAADGAIPGSSTVEPFAALKDRPGDHALRVALVEEPMRGAAKNCVAYGYFCDGAYLTDAEAMKRRLDAAPRGRRYYAKIELMVRGASKEHAMPMFEAVLPALLQEFETCMPR